MAITTYAELQTAIATWLNRTDLTTLIPDFITMAEADIGRWLRVWWNEKRAYAVPTGSYIALPTDYIGIRNIQWNYSTYRVPLEQVSPEALDRLETFTRKTFLHSTLFMMARSNFARPRLRRTKSNSKFPTTVNPPPW